MNSFPIEKSELYHENSSSGSSAGSSSQSNSKTFSTREKKDDSSYISSDVNEHDESIKSRYSKANSLEKQNYLKEKGKNKKPTARIW